LFDIADVNKAASAFNPEKLLWLNQQHLMRTPPAKVAPYFKAHLARLGLPTDDSPLIEGVILAQRERTKTLKDMAQASRYFFADSLEFDAKAVAKHLTAESKAMLATLRERLAALPSWEAPAIHAVIETLATELGVGLGKIAQPVRVAVSGGTVSPPIDQTLALLGRERTLARLAAA
ncbi:MAG: glutamate--tRNA ligase, partial [Burkholderiales bacterium]|nr:glutamate--tRNA ligase [Burkholderiales bacterium]